VALAFAVTPLLGALIFEEPITVRLVIGLGLIVCGLFFVAG
jgi:multidrug transporter EmrE-like cation transporter